LQFLSLLNSADHQELLVGNHTFNFNFTLPLTIPSSVFHHYGKVLYQIKVEMERQLKFNYSFKFPFNVISRLDLNHEGGEIRKPLRGDISKKFFLGFGSCALQIGAQIPFRGFVGGQTLSIDVEVVNESSINVESIFVELRKLFLFKCDFISTKNHSEVLVKGNHKGVLAKSKGQLTFSFEIPPVEPTSVHFCKYIHISYEVVVIAKVGGLHRSPELNIPITIGTTSLSGMEIASTSVNPPSYEEVLNANEVDEKKIDT
jgi:Arrestin (or S-antigen), C-terminal domain/Arrestin (or S-antigen), N-terminal domain